MQVALGKEPADVILSGGRILNVFTGKWERKDVAVAEGLIACLEENLKGKNRFDLEDRLLVPGFIDAHIHLESTHLWLPEISRLMLAHGVTSLVADPHEMANVRGLEGVRAILEASRQADLDVFFKAPSCVPASQFEEPGAQFGIDDIKKLLGEPEVIGLAEMMNFQGVLTENQEIWDKLGLSRNIDGHAPGLRGRGLQAYTGAEIRTDHETSSGEEGAEKIKLGMWLFIREGSAARNLDALLPVLDDYTWRRACFCSDDLTAEDLLNRGSIDYIVRQAVQKGLSAERALVMASWNAAQAHRLENIGAIAPGYIADITVLEHDSLKVVSTFKRGCLVVNGYRRDYSLPIPCGLGESVKLPNIYKGNFLIPYKSKMKAIRVKDREILTGIEDVSPLNAQGFAEADPERDILKAALIERHRGTGKIGLGLVKGFGLKQGAMASTVSHDAHNLIIIGTCDEDMLLAARKLTEAGGGQILVRNGEILAMLCLPIAGLMSDEPANKVTDKIKALKDQAHRAGCELPDPFATLSFLALSVIPRARLTTYGFLDVEKWEIVK